jgi:F-type H+-transporting ATPase subunit b
VVSLDYSLGIQIINFLLLIFILNVLLYKPILGLIDRRKKQFEDSEAEIRRLQESVEQKMAAYEEKLRQAKAAAVEQKNEIIRQGAEEAKTVIDAVRAFRRSKRTAGQRTENGKRTRCPDLLSPLSPPL